MDPYETEPLCEEDDEFTGITDEEEFEQYKPSWSDERLAQDCKRPGCLHRGACGAGSPL